MKSNIAAELLATRCCYVDVDVECRLIIAPGNGMKYKEWANEHQQRETTRQTQTIALPERKSNAKHCVQRAVYASTLYYSYSYCKRVESRYILTYRYRHSGAFFFLLRNNDLHVAPTFSLFFSLLVNEYFFLSLFDSQEKLGFSSSTFCLFPLPKYEQTGK